MKTGTNVNEMKDEPKYMGPCLISTITLGEIQPPLDQWVPPQNYKYKGWEPRITYRGLTPEQVEAFTNSFQMFEEESSEEEEKGFVLITSLPMLFRAMNMNDAKQNLKYTESCQAKSVDHPSGGHAIHLTSFLMVMDDELRQDAIRQAQGYADRLTKDLQLEEEEAAKLTKDRLEAEDAERRKKKAIQDIIAKRRDHYLRNGASERITAVRRAVAKNETAALNKWLDPYKPQAPAAPSTEAEGDPIISEPLAQVGDTEGLVTLHQLAVERNPRPRGRPPPGGTLGDVSAYLELFPLADALPQRAAPWQRNDPEPKTLSMVRTLKKERDYGFAPYLPPPIYWENREAAIQRGLEHTVIRENNSSEVPMWPVPTWAEEKEMNEIREARMDGRKIIRKSTLGAVEPDSPLSVAGSEASLKMTLAEKAIAKAKAAEAHARTKADQQIADLRQAQDAKAWELMRRRSRLKTLQQASLRGRLEHNLKRLGLSIPMKLEKHKSFHEPVHVSESAPKLAAPKHPRPPKWVLQSTFKELGQVSSLAINRKYLAVGRADEHVAVWNLEKKQRIAKYSVPFVIWLPERMKHSEEAQVHPSFVSGSGDGRLRVFSPYKVPVHRSGEPSAASGICGGGWSVVQTVRCHRTAVTCGHMSYDNKWLATGCAGGVTAGDRLSGTIPVIRVWALGSVVGTSQPITTPSFSPVESSVESGVDFDLSSLNVSQRVEPVINQCTGLFEHSAAAEGTGHSTSITSLTWIPLNDNSASPLYHLLSGSRDGELRQWCCRLQCPDSDNVSQQMMGASDPVPNAAASLQIVRVFRSGDMQVSSCAFLRFGSIAPRIHQIKGENQDKVAEKSQEVTENYEVSRQSSSESESENEQDENVRLEKAKQRKAEIDTMEEEYFEEISQHALNLVLDDVMETLMESSTQHVLKQVMQEPETRASLESKFKSSMVQIVVGDAAGVVNVWSLHLPDRSPLEEEELFREMNAAPSPRSPGAKPAGRRIAPKPRPPTCTFLSEFDHCTVRKCFPISPTSPSSESVLLALSNPFASGVLDLGALQGAPVVDTQSGHSTSWLCGHSGGLMCATGNALRDTQIRRQGATDGPFLLTGGGDWSICEWQLTQE